MKRIIGLIWLVLLTAIPAFATVSTETTRVAYTCNGVLTSYAYPFKVLADGDLLVVKKATATATSAETTLVLNTDYTVTGAGTSGGNVVLTAGSKCGSGYTLAILRNMAATQTTDYVDGEAFSAESLETALDKATLVLQQQKEQIGRAPKLPKTSTITDIALPNPTASNYIGWNAAATGLENKSGPVITTATQYEVDALVSYGGGTSYTQATIEAALTAIGTTNKATLLLRPGTWVISSNADWSAYTNVTFKIVPGAKLSGAFTLNIPNVEAGMYQIFDSTLGVVTFSGAVKEVYPQWWGAKGDDTTDCTSAIVSALASITHGRVFFPKGDYLTTASILVPSGITLKGVGVVSGPGSIGAVTWGSTIHGKHTGVSIISMKGSYICSIQDLSLWGDATTYPKTGLLLGRSSGPSAGRHYFSNLNVNGSFSKAAIYSIASEENSWHGLLAAVYGGTAQYTYYTSTTDDLSVDTLTTGSNFNNSMFGFNILHQGSVNSSAAIYIGATSYSQAFYGGFTGMTSGATSSHVVIVAPAEGITFDNVGHESSSNASPPIQFFKITGANPSTATGISIKNNFTGQFLGGTQWFIYGDDNVTIKDLQVNYDNPSYGHPSSVWRIDHSQIHASSFDFTARSAIVGSIVDARNVISGGVGGAIVKTLSLSPVYGPNVFTGSGVDAVTVSTATVFTGSVQRLIRVEVEDNGSPNHFKWSDDGGSTWEALTVAITGSDQTLAEGIVIKFSQTTGLTIGDRWDIKFDPTLLPNASH